MNPLGIVLHHSASPFGDPALIRAWHIERKWSDIGYHRLILNGFRRSTSVYDPSIDGHVSIGRAEPGGVKRPGAHVEGYNSILVGVCMIGDSSLMHTLGSPDRRAEQKWFLGPQGRQGNRYLSQAQIDALIPAVARLCQRYGLNPLHQFTVPSGPLRGQRRHVLSQHSDWDRGKPWCAGLNMSTVRRAVADAMEL